MTEPRKPRAKSRRKPAKRKVLSPEQALDLDLEAAARCLTVDERALAHLSVEYSLEHAAAVLGWDLAAVQQVWKMPAVQKYLMKAEEIFLHKLASQKIRALRKVNINAGTVETRLMEIAMMDPHETRGSVDGQVKALAVLAKTLGMTDDKDPLKGKSRKDLEELVAGTARRIIPGVLASPPQHTQ